MNTMKKIGVALCCLAMAACGPLTTATAPPQLPGSVQVIGRSALAFALNTFDAALYGLDFAMAAKGTPFYLEPGSAKAKEIAAVGRQVQGFLQAAEAARRVGNAASYEEAFANANLAMSRFKILLGRQTAGMPHIHFTPYTAQGRSEILARAAG